MLDVLDSTFLRKMHSHTCVSMSYAIVHAHVLCMIIERLEMKSSFLLLGKC